MTTRAEDHIHDVIQIGYGPVGQTLALALGSRGRDVVVVERHSALFELCRAGHIDHEVMRILQTGAVAQRLEHDLVPSTGFTLMDSELTVLADIAAVTPSASGWSPDYMIYQSDLEQALHSAVSELPGVAVQWGHEAIELVQQPDHVAVTVRTVGDDAGATHTLRARFVVGVDGANSAVRSMIGKSYDTDFGFAGPWLVCDFKHHDPDVDLGWDAAGQILDVERPTTVGRWLGRAHSRVEFMLLPGETEADFATEESVWALAAKLNLSPRTSELERRAVYTFRSLLVDDWRAGRVLLAGDAAHLMPPFLGQGMCSGIRDAQNLAWKLDLVLRGVAGEDLLDSYTVERRPHVAAIISSAVQLGGLITTTDAEQAARRDAMLSDKGAPPPLPPLPGLTTGIISRTSTGAGNAAIGQLGVQSRIVIGDRTGLLDDVVGAGWHVLSRRPIHRDDLSPGNLSLLDALDARLLHVSPAPISGAALDLDLRYSDWFRRIGSAVVVVRPDHYVFGVAADAAGLSAVLDDLRAQMPMTQQTSLAGV